jgi:hypothetical protein
MCWGKFIIRILIALTQKNLWGFQIFKSRLKLKWIFFIKFSIWALWNIATSFKRSHWVLSDEPPKRSERQFLPQNFFNTNLKFWIFVTWKFCLQFWSRSKFSASFRRSHWVFSDDIPYRSMMQFLPHNFFNLSSKILI